MEHLLALDIHTFELLMLLRIQESTTFSRGYTKRIGLFKKGLEKKQKENRDTIDPLAKGCHQRPFPFSLAFM